MRTEGDALLKGRAWAEQMCILPLKGDCGVFAEKVKERCRGGDVPRWDLEEERLKKVELLWQVKEW